MHFTKAAQRVYNTLVHSRIKAERVEGSNQSRQSCREPAAGVSRQTVR